MKYSNLNYNEQCPSQCHIEGMTWEKGNMEMTCSHCGANNVVEYTNYPDRDKGEVFCAGCGGSLHKWEGTRDFGEAVLKEKPND